MIARKLAVICLRLASVGLALGWNIRSGVFEINLSVQENQILIILAVLRRSLTNNLVNSTA